MASLLVSGTGIPSRGSILPGIPWAFDVPRAEVNWVTFVGHPGRRNLRIASQRSKAFRRPFYALYNRVRSPRRASAVARGVI